MRYLGIASLIIWSAAVAHADIIVDFGDVDYLGGNSAVDPSLTYSVGDYDGDGNADDQQALSAFDDTTPIPFSASYLGQPIYGGLRATATDDTDYFQDLTRLFMRHIIRGNSSDPDFYRGQNANDPNGNGTFQCAIAWMKGDFLNGGDAQPVVFDSTSSLTLRGGAYRMSVGRFLVKDAGQYYVSEQTFSFAEGDTETMTFATDDSDGNWAAWDQSLSFLPTSFAMRNFTDIQGVGLLMQHNEHDTTQGANFNIDSFEVDAVIVPEPASLAMIALGSLLIRRRR